VLYDQRQALFDRQKAFSLQRKELSRQRWGELIDSLKGEGIFCHHAWIFGSECLSVSDAISEERDQDIQRRMKHATRAIVRESLNVSRLTVVHRKGSVYSPEQFTEIVQRTCSKFSDIVLPVGKYKPFKPTTRHSPIQGQVYVSVINPLFTITVAGELKAALVGVDSAKLVIPETIATSGMLNDPDTISEMRAWFARNGLHVHREGYDWSGPRAELDRAYRLMMHRDRGLQGSLSKRVFPIPRSVDQDQISKIVKLLNRGVSHKNDSVRYDSFNHVLIAPRDREEAIKSQFEKFEQNRNVIGCIEMCADRQPSTLPITIYREKGEETRRFCFECLQATLKFAIQRFIVDPEDSRCILDMERLLLGEDFLDSILGNLGIVDDNQMSKWPKVPLGQFVWQVVQDPALAKFAKAWVTGAAAQALRSHPRSLVMCPDHPRRLFFVDDAKCKVSGCGKELCQSCGQWHGRRCPKDTWKGRRCPACNAPTVKEEGCNHIACRCGKHWCYACTVSPVFDTPGECYQHMTKTHGGFYDARNLH
jgi:hypothetical protein